MNTIVFWILFFGLCLFALVGNYNKSKSVKNKRISEIENNYHIRKNASDAENVNYDSISGYFDYLKAENEAGRGIGDFYIDEITWNDLNMNSVYSVVNKTLTSCGEEVLYAKLHTICADLDNPRKFYSDMEEIKQNSEKRSALIRCFDNLGKTKAVSSYRIIDKLFKAQAGNAFYDIAVDILIIICFVLIFIVPIWGMILFLISLFVGISSYFRGKAEMKENLRAFCYCIKLLRCARGLSGLIPEEKTLSDNRISGLLSGAFLVPNKDGSTSNPFSIIYDYIMMIFHIDIIVYKMRMNDIVRNKELISDVFYLIGYYDAVMSVSSFINCENYYCRAELLTDSVEMKACELYHPLNTNPVANDLITDRSVLITGSNASGKSTFLKMVGLAAIFASSFGFALAKEFSIGHFDLYSSMSLSDNILGEESYYVVESKSLKRICDAAASGRHVLVIVDEVLRGTNTTERIAASCKILEDLAKRNTLCLVATHDTELTYLLENSYDNYYFTEVVNDNNVIFPYKIYKGVSASGNAIKLLRTLGYSREVTDAAEALVADYEKTGKWENK